MGPQDGSKRNQTAEATRGGKPDLVNQESVHERADPRAEADPLSGETELPAVLTVREVASFLRVDVKGVYAAIKQGQLPAKRVGKRIIVLREALLGWLQEDREHRWEA